MGGAGGGFEEWMTMRKRGGGKRNKDMAVGGWANDRGRGNTRTQRMRGCLLFLVLKGGSKAGEAGGLGGGQGVKNT